MQTIPRNDFVFKKHMTIGQVAAEDDKEFLDQCFVETGDYDVLVDTKSPKSIIVGRTGVGKSALLEQIEKNNPNRTIRIKPEELSLTYISNSTILNFLESKGVRLTIFYHLLWQHMFAVELIKHKYGINSEQKNKSALERIKSLLTDRNKELALSYIQKWGGKFWLDTETRIREFTTKVEKNLGSKIESNVPGVKADLNGFRNLSEEQVSDVIHYGQKVVDDVQVKELHQVTKLLAEDVLDEVNDRTFIIIDKLDEDWVDDKIRYKLIKALWETIKKFQQVKAVKIVIAIRTDLVNRVLDRTPSSGFQKEKYRNYFLELNWTKVHLKQLLDKRVNHLLKHKYTNSEVCFDSVFPSQIEKTSSIDYVLDRTLLRPRDAIMFVNECFIEAEGKAQITPELMKLAEKKYSHDRVESLSWEWKDEHPFFNDYLDILRQQIHRFKVSEIGSDGCEKLIFLLVDKHTEFSSPLMYSARQYIENSLPENLFKFKQELLFVFYQLGIVGIKVDNASRVSYMSDRTQSLVSNHIRNTSIIYVHRILWRALGVNRKPN